MRRRLSVVAPMAITVRVFLTLAVVLTVGYGVISFIAHRTALRALFLCPPSSYQWTGDYVRLMTLDGVALAGRHWDNPQATHTLIYFHGNGEDLGTLEPFAAELVAGGYAVFAVDYRCYGRSEGRPTEENAWEDARVAYDYLRHQLGVPPERIVLYGFSLGSGPAVDLAMHRSVAGLVLQSPLASAYRVVNVRWVQWLLGDVFVNIDRIADVPCPILIMHSRADEVIPFWHGEALLRAATARKESLFVDDVPHGGLSHYAGERYWDALRRFTDSL